MRSVLVLAHRRGEAVPARQTRSVISTLANPRGDQRFAICPERVNRLECVMPIYEYTAEDGTKLELIRAMSEADKPVEDPDGKGRVFKRALSVFTAQGGTPGVGKSAGHTHSGACCPCGKKPGSCGGA